MLRIIQLISFQIENRKEIEDMKKLLLEIKTQNIEIIKSLNKMIKMKVDKIDWIHQTEASRVKNLRGKLFLKLP